MHFDARQFFEIGNRLAREAAGDDRLRAGRLRTVYGRSYYGLFLLVRDALVSRLGVPDHKVTHGRLSGHLQNSSLPEEVRKIGRELERLYDYRRMSDYVLDLPAKWEAILYDVRTARSIVDHASRIGRTIDHVDLAPAARILSSR